MRFRRLLRLMREDAWIDAAGFAKLAGISGQKARRALGRAVEGHLWRGFALEVREVFGRGGKAGLSYEVSLRSVLEALGEDAAPQLHFHPLPAVPPPPRDIAGTVVQHGNRNRREAAVLPLVELQPGTSERAAALEAMAKKTGVSARTLNRWCDLYLKYGVNGLANRKPKNAGQRRPQVSRAFDKAFLAAGYQDELLGIIAAETIQVIKGLWKSRREASGCNAVVRDAETLLQDACDNHGVKLPDVAFKLSRRRIEEFVDYRAVNIYRNDRKRFDENRGRITRDWTHLNPMQVVVADVKPLDVIVLRPDGSPAWPRLIGFHDAATFRLFGCVVLCNPGESIRQEHVHEAFIAMAMDPEWGVPRSLYLDNGSEFGGLEKLRDAMSLLADEGARTIVYARPYNASAKPIESNFARLDKLFTCTLPGYAGKDRMTKKTQTVGKPPAPYPHSFERFVEEVQLGLADLNHTPLTPKHWRGLSPHGVWQEAVDAGWRPVTVDPLVIDAALGVFETRVVGKGERLRIGAKNYPVPGLRPGSRVTVALSWRRGADPLYRAHGSDTWIPLVEDHPFPADGRTAPETAPSATRLRSASSARWSATRRRSTPRMCAAAGRSAASKASCLSLDLRSTRARS